MKIHITEHTKQLLDELGGYIVEPRGNMEIKVFLFILHFVILERKLRIDHETKIQGKGLMSTYWLVDKEGGLPKKEVELSIPGFFKPEKNDQPEFLHEIFGSSGSEDGDEPVKIQVSRLLLPHSNTTSNNIGSNSSSRMPMGSLMKKTTA